MCINLAKLKCYYFLAQVFQVIQMVSNRCVCKIFFPKQPPPVYSVKKKVFIPGEARSYHQMLNIVEKRFIILPMNQQARVSVWHCLGISGLVFYLSVFIHSSCADNRSKETINSGGKNVNVLFKGGRNYSKHSFSCLLSFGITMIDLVLQRLRAA